MRGLILSALLLAAGHAAALPPVQQRDATAEERDSFTTFYRERLPAGRNGAAPLFAPAFDISRRGREPWQVIARVESGPRHIGPDLCQQVRSSFIYDSKAKSWAPSAAEPEWHVWLGRTDVVCSAVKYTVLMNPAVPKADAAELLRHAHELLLRARLLFAGNSSCARQRALTFRLSAIEPSPPVYGGPVMFGLVFESDRDTQATVAVRKHRGEYVAWNVSCK